MAKKRKEGGDHTIFERLGKVKESGRRCLERQNDFERASERVRDRHERTDRRTSAER